VSSLANPLAPPPADPAPGPSVRGALAWMDLMESCEQLLLAGLRRDVGQDGDLQGAFRAWYVRQMANRDRERLRRAARGRHGF